jgi:Protein of unknown function (DUF1565)
MRFSYHMMSQLVESDAHRRLALGAGILVSALCLAACGSEGTTPPSDEEPDPPAGCERPNRQVGELCIVPGMQDDGCEAGTWLQPDGSCLAAGVEPPPTCPPGQMAAVGESACAPVMDCGTGPWGELPVDGATVYVDAAFVGMSTGSETAPFTTIGEALDAAGAGALVAVAAGTYVEDVRVTGKPVQLWGVCPDAVVVQGVGQELGALNVRIGAAGSVVGGMSITGPGTGAFVTGSVDVTFENLWLHDIGSRGLDVEGALGPTSLTLRHSLVEGASEFGVFVAGGAVTLDAVVVRDTVPEGLSLGRGVNAQASATGDTALYLVDSVIERSAAIGLYVASAVATVERTVVRWSEQDGAGFVIGDDGVTPSVVNVVSSTFDANRISGIWVASSEVSLTGVEVRDTLPREMDLAGGRGLTVELTVGSTAGAVVDVLGSRFDRNSNIGLFVGASTANLQGVVVADTFPNASDGLTGRGINIENDIVGGAPSYAAIGGSLVERNAEMAIAVLGSEAHLLSTLVRGTAVQGPSGALGRGLAVQASVANGVPSVGSATSSQFEMSGDSGVFASGATLELDSVVVRDTAGTTSATFGDGVLASGQEGPTSVAVRRSLVENSARAALSNFGAHMIVESSTLQCQQFDIAAESVPSEPTFDNLGGNACGCPAELDACKTASSGLSPPLALE